MFSCRPGPLAAEFLLQIQFPQTKQCHPFLPLCLCVCLTARQLCCTRCRSSQETPPGGDGRQGLHHHLWGPRDTGERYLASQRNRTNKFERGTRRQGPNFTPPLLWPPFRGPAPLGPGGCLGPLWDVIDPWDGICPRHPPRASGPLFPAYAQALGSYSSGT